MQPRIKTAVAKGANGGGKEVKGVNLNSVDESQE